MFALAALASGLAIAPISQRSVVGLLAAVLLCAFIYNWVVNLVLVSAVLAVSSSKPFFKLIVDNVRQTTAPFALMTSAALMLVVSGSAPPFSRSRSSGRCWRSRSTSARRSRPSARCGSRSPTR
jgi:hypothetical protein